MPARLFCYIKTTFARFNKTVFFGLAALILIVVAVKIADAQTATPSPDQAALDKQYAAYSGLFTGGLSNPLVQTSDSNNDAAGLTFTVNLNTQPINGSLANNWKMLQPIDDSSEDVTDNFIIELCNNGNTSQCWLSGVAGNVQAASSGANQGYIYAEDAKGNPVSTETVTVDAFSSDDTVYTYHPSDQTSYDLSNGLTLQQGSQGTASLWYCASGNGAKAAGDYKAAGITAPTPVAGTITTTPANFGTLCASAFPVGAPVAVTIPSNTSAIQQQVAASAQALTTNSNVSSSEDDNLPECGIIPTSSGTINGCGAQLAYLLYQLCAWVAGLFGELFDFFIGYSLSSSSYTYPFVVTGWDLVRDISNIFFIIIMVWTGFSAVFDTNTTSMKKVVPNLIINALLINFSLFATRVVIDISNITARVFYNQMVVCKQANVASNNCTASNGITGTGGYPSLSVKIVSAFNPQDMFKQSVINPPAGNTTDSTQNITVGAANLTVISTDRQIANYFAIVSLVAAAIMIVIGIMFFKVAFLFVGRVVGLYICMIFSPFAFMSRDIPMFSGVERLRWTDWSKELTSYAMLAPVFVFFLYIIYTFLSSNFVQQIGIQSIAASGFFATVMSIVIPMLIIFFLLQAAQKTAEKLAGEIGRSIQKFGEQATGFVAGAAVGIATGGVSLAGTSAAGAFKLSDEKRANLEAQKAAGGISGRMASLQLKSSDWTQRQTFDARNTKGVQLLTKQFGANANNSLVNTLGFGSDRTKGGRENMIKRKADETKKEIESVKVNVKDPKAFWQEKIERDTEKKLLADEKKTIADQKKNAKTEEEKTAAKKHEEDFKKAKKDKTYKDTDFYKNAIKAAQDDADSTYGKVNNNKQLTQALRVKYATTLEKRADNINPKDMVSIPTMLGGVTEGIGKKKGARTFLNEHKKFLNEKPLDERLIEENKKVKNKTTQVENKIKELESKHKVIYEAEVARIKADPTLKDLPENKDISVDHFTDEKNADRAKSVIEKHREELKNKADALELDIKRADAQYTESMSKDDTIMAAGHQKVRDALIATRNKHNADYELLDPEQKEKLEDKLSNLHDKLNSNDEKLGRINEPKPVPESK